MQHVGNVDQKLVVSACLIWGDLKWLIKKIIIQLTET